MSTESPVTRYADLDFVRVMAIALLHLFHTGMMFNVWRWHVKNDVLLPVLTVPWEILHIFRMPLLMVVAGAGTALALKRRSLRAFAGERARRLLWPVLFAMLVVVPPQIYIERIVQGLCHPTFLEPLAIPRFQGSYWDFYPMVLQFRPYPLGAFSWHHLWFVVYLFTYSLLALPLFAWLRRPSGDRFLVRIDGWLARGFRLYLLFIPLFLVQYFLREFPQTGDLVGDPRILAYFGILFLYGYLLARCPSLLDRAVTLRGPSLGLGLLLLAILLPEGEFPRPFEHLAVYACVWLVILAALGYARCHIRTRGPMLVRAQELAYPFYLLHQTVIVLVGYAWLHAPMGPWVKLSVVLTLSFFVTALLCEGIRRTPFLRPLFGMKAQSRISIAAIAEPVA